MKALLIEETEGKWVIFHPSSLSIDLPHTEWVLPEQYESSRKVYTEDEAVITCPCPSQILVDTNDVVTLDANWETNLMYAGYQAGKLYAKRQQKIDNELALETPNVANIMKWQNEQKQIVELIDDNSPDLENCKAIFKLSLDQLIEDTTANAAKPLIRKQLQAKLGIPINLLAIEGDTQVELDWDSVEGAVSYKIYWGTETGVYTNNDTSDVSGYTIAGLTNGTPYFVVVAAIDGEAIESGKSDEKEATPVAA